MIYWRHLVIKGVLTFSVLVGFSDSGTGFGARNGENTKAFTGRASVRASRAAVIESRRRTGQAQPQAGIQASRGDEVHYSGIVLR